MDTSSSLFLDDFAMGPDWPPLGGYLPCSTDGLLWMKMGVAKKNRGLRSDETKKLEGDGLLLDDREIGKRQRKIGRKET